MACLKGDSRTLETRLYIVFNHGNDEAARRCPQHLMSIFHMLRQVPHIQSADGSRKVIPNELRDNFIKICLAIHNYSFDIFAHRVTKRQDKLSDIRECIQQDQTYFSPQQRSTLVNFLQHVDAIIRDAAGAQARKQLPTVSVQMLLSMYSYWTEHNLLPKDGVADNKATLLDMADGWLVKGT